MNEKKLYVITICYNNLDGLKKTFASVHGVDKSKIDFNWIVIDGSSTDGTLEFLKSLKLDYNFQWLSEKDSGIYNAMNKSSLFINPDSLVLFMNSGDEFSSTDIVNECLRKVPDYFAVACFSASIIKPNGQSVVISPRPARQAWTGMPTSHQAMVFNSGVFLELLYDESYKLGGDYDLYCRIVRKYKERCFIFNDVLCNYYLDGVSELKRKDALKENYRSRVESLKMGRLRASVLYLMHFLHMNLKRCFPSLMAKLRR